MIAIPLADLFTRSLTVAIRAATRMPSANSEARGIRVAQSSRRRHDKYNEGALIECTAYMVSSTIEEVRGAPVEPPCDASGRRVTVCDRYN